MIYIFKTSRLRTIKHTREHLRIKDKEVAQKSMGQTWSCVWYVTQDVRKHTAASQDLVVVLISVIFDTHQKSQGSWWTNHKASQRLELTDSCGCFRGWLALKLRPLTDKDFPTQEPNTEKYTVVYISNLCYSGEGWRIVILRTTEESPALKIKE